MILGCIFYWLQLRDFMSYMYFYDQMPSLDSSCMITYIVPMAVYKAKTMAPADNSHHAHGGAIRTAACQFLIIVN